MNRTTTRWLAAILLLAGAHQAFATGTTANTTVTNEVTVSYEVGGVAQTAVLDDVDFVVDRQILLTVAESGGTYTNVSPNEQNAVLTFTVTNNSNETLDFGLAAANGDDPHGGTDDFDPTGIQVFVEDGTTGGFQPAEDTATFIDELAEDATITVYVIADIPADAADAESAGITLTATAAEGGAAATEGAAVTEDAGPDGAMTVETVFGDTAGDTDGSEDGAHSDSDAYLVQSATISVTKSSTVISDPFNGITDPKAIPGAVIEYCILIENTGGTAATAVAVTDPIPANTTYSAGTIVVADDCAGTNASAEDDDAAGADETDGISGSFAGNQVSTEVDNLAGSADTATIFRVTVD